MKPKKTMLTLKRLMNMMGTMIMNMFIIVIMFFLQLNVQLIVLV